MPAKKKPTDKQVAILLYVADTIESLGSSPSYRKIAERFGIGGTTAFSLVGALRDQGLVNAGDDADGGIEVTVAGQNELANWRKAKVKIA